MNFNFNNCFYLGGFVSSYTHTLQHFEVFFGSFFNARNQVQEVGLSDFSQNKNVFGKCGSNYINGYIFYSILRCFSGR